MKLHSKTEIQKALINAGYDVGKAGADGKFGDDTISALHKFQNNRHIAPSMPDEHGVYNIDDETINLLFPEDVSQENPMNSVIAEVKSSLFSKINWTLVATVILNILAFLGVAVPEDLKPQIMALITTIGSIIAIVQRTWFTTSITKASAQKLPNV